MYKQIDERFDIIKNRFVNSGYSTSKIEKAYSLAKNLHQDQRRKDGQLYITHPVEVALILSNLDFDEDVIIGEGCWIGTRAIILKGVTIGKGSVVGAGAVVTKDIPPYSIYVGVPTARVFPRFTEEEIIEHERMLKTN